MMMLQRIFSQASFTGVRAFSTQPAETSRIYDFLKEKTSEMEFKDAYIECTRELRWTFKEVKTFVDAFATGLNENRHPVGSRSVSTLPCNSDLFVWLLGSAVAGVSVVGLNPNADSASVKNALVQTNARSYYFSPKVGADDMIPRVRSLIPETTDLDYGDILKSKDFKNLKYVVQTGIDGRIPGFSLYKEFLVFNPMPSPLPKLNVTGNTDWILAPLGGDKFARLSQSALLSQGRIQARAFGFGFEDRVLFTPALYKPHVIGGILGCFQNSAVAVIPSDLFNTELLLSRIPKEKCSVVYSSPSHILQIINSDKFGKTNVSSVKKVIVVADSWQGEKPLNAEERKNVGKAFAVDNVESAIASSATSGILWINGSFVKGLNLRVENGKLFANGPSVMSGVLNGEPVKEWANTGISASGDKDGISL